MTDTVLQSFCERCGTRYTFTEQQEKPESGRSMLGRLGRRSSDDASDDSSDDSSDEPTVATALPSNEGFEGTFHFCLECRQYTCASCWNAQAGYCLSCRPHGQTPALDSAASATTPAATPSTWANDDVERAAAATALRHAHGHAHATLEPASSASKPEEDRSPVVESASDQDRKPDPDLPWKPDQKRSVDEWGRPLAEQPAPSQHRPSGEDDVGPDPDKPAIDPWRGVVFSGGSDGVAQPSTGEQTTERDVFAVGVTEDTSALAASAPSGPTGAEPAWPQVDGTSATSSDLPPAESPWPGEDRQPEPSATETSALGGTASDNDPDTQDQAGIGATIEAVPPLANVAETDSPDDDTAAATATDVSDAATSDFEVAAPEATAPPGSEPLAAVSEDATPRGDDANEESGGSEGRAAADVEQATEGVTTGAPADGSITAEISTRPDTEQAEPEEAQLSAAERILGVTAAAAVVTEQVAPESREAPATALPASDTTGSTAAPDVPSDVTLTFVDPGPTELEPATTAETAPEPSPASPAKTESPVGAEATPVEAEPIAAGPESTSPDPASQQPPVAPLAPLAPTGSPAPLTTPPASGPFAEPYREPTAPQAPPPVPAQPAPIEQPAPVVLTAQGLGSAATPPPIAMPQPQAGMAAAPVPPPAAAQASQPPPGYAAPLPLPMPSAPLAAKRTGSQGCPNCGLPLSAKARFCRRCGAPQASA